MFICIMYVCSLSPLERLGQIGSNLLNNPLVLQIIGQSINKKKKKKKFTKNPVGNSSKPNNVQLWNKSSKLICSMACMYIRI